MPLVPGFVGGLLLVYTRLVRYLDFPRIHGFFAPRLIAIID